MFLPLKHTNDHLCVPVKQRQKLKTNNCAPSTNALIGQNGQLVTNHSQRLALNVNDRDHVHVPAQEINLPKLPHALQSRNQNHKSLLVNVSMLKDFNAVQV
jgi:hypothetical protein